MSPMLTDEYFMQQALRQAEEAFEAEETPIGAVIVSQNRIIGKGRNETERLQDPTAHAEILAITAACSYLSSRLLTDCTLYVTIEPCPMCAGALRWAQLGRLVYGAPEPKTGYSRHQPGLLHPRTQVRAGVLAGDCAALMQTFFQRRRS